MIFSDASIENDLPQVYRPSEVGALFRVDPKTLSRWADDGILHPITLPSGHRRYLASEIHALIDTGGPSDDLPVLLLRMLVRDHFNGDIHAAMEALNALHT